MKLMVCLKYKDVPDENIDERTKEFVRHVSLVFVHFVIKLTLAIN